MTAVASINIISVYLFPSWAHLHWTKMFPYAKSPMAYKFVEPKPV